jgi:hypothetical protein
VQAKIEKYEQDVQAGLADKLNEDQRAAVQKKDEVATLIKELEEIVHLMEDKDTEVRCVLARDGVLIAQEQKRIKKAKKQEEVEKQHAVQAAAAAAKAEGAAHVRALLQLFFATNTILPQTPATNVSNQAREAVVTLFNAITGVGALEPLPQTDALVDKASMILEKYTSASQDLVVQDCSCAFYYYSAQY